MIHMVIDTGFTKCMRASRQCDGLYQNGRTEWTHDGALQLLQRPTHATGQLLIRTLQKLHGIRVADAFPTNLQFFSVEDRGVLFG
jgi:hypothetical protein